MARRREPVEHAERECGAPGCTNRFTPKRSTALYCSQTCCRRAARARKAAEQSTTADAASGRAEHALVKAVRLELEQAGRDQTFSGQLALQLARKLTDPEEKAATALSKELRTVMAAALGGASPAASDGKPAAPAEDDEVTRAREARERKAREASAGRA